MAARISKAPCIIRIEFKSTVVRLDTMIITPQLIQSCERSEWFYSDVLPNVKFNICVKQLSISQSIVVISKMPSDPVKATIKVELTNYSPITINPNNWTDSCLVSHPKVPERWVGGVCEIKWGGFTEHSDPTPPISLYRQTKRFFAEPDFADVAIVVDDTKIPAHRVVLAAQSSVFSTILKTNMSESVNKRINVRGIDIDIMKQVIQFMYAGEIDTGLDTDDLLSILSAAEKYQIIDLKQTCAESLTQKITVENSLEILQAADLYRVPQLVQCINVFMVKNKQEIIELDDYKDLLSRKPRLLSDFITRGIQEEENFFCSFGWT